MYCDMCEHLLWNLCEGPKATYCFDMTARELRFPEREGLEARDPNDDGTYEKELMGLRKRYSKVDEWKG